MKTIPAPLVLADDRFIRMPEVKQLTGLSRAQIYNLIQLGRFPRQVKITEKASAWLLSEVATWMQSRLVVTRQEARHE